MTFDSRLPGTPPEAWTADDRFSALPPLDLGTVGELLVIAAHPDDETLGAGGLMAEAARRGIPVRVTVVTDGGASHPLSRSMRPARLVELRREEVLNATRLLAPESTLTFLDIGDGTVDRARERVAGDLKRIVHDATPAALLVAPWRGDRHRDHRVLGQLCAEAVAGSSVRLLEYPIWMWHWASPGHEAIPWDELSVVRLDHTTVAAKRRAIGMHRSQIDRLSDEAGDEAVLAPAFLANFDRDVEVFIGPVGHAFSPGSADPTVQSSYFDAVYDRRDDPWGLETRWYEARKRALTLASLPHHRYASIFEIGCSIGVLTEQLASRCDRLHAVDIAAAAVERARARLAGAPHVSIERSDVKSDYPAGPFDLVVMSEVGYYFALPALRKLFGLIGASLTVDGSVVLCHWRHPVDDHSLSGDEVHREAASVPGWNRVSQHLEEDFVLEVYSRDSRSVARQTGLLP